MSVPNLVDMPDTCAATITMTLNSVVGENKSPFTFQSQFYDWGGQQWIADITFPPFNSRQKAAEWQSFGLQLRGKFGVFLMGDPLGKNPMGTALGNPVVDGSGQTGNILQTTGWTPNQIGALKKGDYIQYGSGINARLHFVLNDVNADASGNANINIAPQIRYSPLNGQQIIVNDPKGAFKLTENSWSWSASPGPLYRIRFSAMEYVSQ